jgi:hypothetical protein
MIEQTLNSSRPLALPSTLYSFVGYPITIYFRNIMDYHPNDVYVRKYGIRGRQYADRWEYTPTTAETVEGDMRVYNHNYVEMNNVTARVVVKDSTVKDVLDRLLTSIDKYYDDET